MTHVVSQSFTNGDPTENAWDDELPAGERRDDITIEGFDDNLHDEHDGLDDD